MLSTIHFGTNIEAAPVFSAPVLFGKSWQRNGYALKGKGENQSPYLSRPLCLQTAALPALLELCCHVSGGCYCSLIYKGIKIKIKKREDAPEGETSHFHGERQCETVTEQGSGICGTVPLCTSDPCRIKRLITG